MSRADGRPVAAIVLAAGSGSRFGGAKQFATLAGERLVDRAIELVARRCDPVVVVLPRGHVWTGAAVRTAVGGDSRGDSVRSGFVALGLDAGIVVVHDAVRPLADDAVLDRVIDAVIAGADAALPVWPLADTVKARRPDGSLEHRGRDGLLVAQGPMAFDAAVLTRVYERLTETPVEETIAVEQLGGRVVGVDGDPWSHHLVDERDLARFDRLVDPISD